MTDKLPEFDTPVFKRLARNDTGQAPGHQGGVVIPKDLSAYFPNLPVASPANPTVEQRVRAILVVPGKAETVVDTRYQHQTWGGTRSPERRLTDNLSVLRDEAQQDDFLIIERGLLDRLLFRLTLVKGGTPEYRVLDSAVGLKRWGTLDAAHKPVTDNDFAKAETEQHDHESLPLQLFDNSAALTESRVRRVARSAAFQKEVVALYGKKCVVCARGLIHPTGGAEVEAAHIVPRHLKGADDARNGLALCRSHHWAFDHGLFGINSAGLISVPKQIKAEKENSFVSDFDNQTLRKPNNAKLAPSPEAFDWHMKHIVLNDG